MKIHVVVALAAAMSLTGAGRAQSGAPRMLTRESIFSRDGRAGAAATRSSAVRGTVAAPVFIGVIKQQDGYVGLLQFTTERGWGGEGGGVEVISVRTGDTIAWDQSTVKEVTWESLLLQGGAADKIQLGYDLENKSKIPAPGSFYRTQDDLNATATSAANVPPGNRPPPAVRPARNNARRNGISPAVNPGAYRPGARGQSGFNGPNAPASPGGT